MAHNRTILLTGTTGFLGAHILDSLLAANYRVLCPVRSIRKTTFFVGKYSDTPYAEMLRFVELKDFSSKDAWKVLLKGVYGVIHSASVVSEMRKLKDPEKDIIEPTVGMAKALFDAAVETEKEGGEIKRFVFTSSSATVYLNPGEKDYDETMWSNVTLEMVIASGNPGLAYCVSKIMADKGLLEWTEEKKPGFEVISLVPPMIFGKSLHEVTPENVGGTAGQILVEALVGKKEFPKDQTPQYINATECATAHVLALTAPLNSKPGQSRRYLIANGSWSYLELVRAILKRYSQMEEKLPKVDDDKKVGFLPKFLTEKAEKELGIKFEKTLEEAAVDEFWSEYVQISGILEK